MLYRGHSAATAKPAIANITFTVNNFGGPTYWAAGVFITCNSKHATYTGIKQACLAGVPNVVTVVRDRTLVLPLHRIKPKTKTHTSARIKTSNSTSACALANCGTPSIVAGP